MMKGYMLAVAALGILGVTRGQEYNEDLDTNKKHRMVFTIAAKNRLGDDKRLERIVLSIRSDTIASVLVRYHDDKFSLFDLSLEADRETFKQLYPPLRLPFIPGVQVKGIYSQEDLSKEYRIDQVWLYRDSTAYIYARGYKPQTQAEALKGNIRQ